jgi:hypothetical protein
VYDYEKVAEKVWCIGPLFLHDKLTFDKFGKEDKNFIDDFELKSECLKLLISNKACSVIYISFSEFVFHSSFTIKRIFLF